MSPAKTNRRKQVVSPQVRFAPSRFAPSQSRFAPSQAVSPQLKVVSPNFEVVSFKVICDVLTNYKRNKMSPL